MNDEILTNQTQFAQEEPILEMPPVPKVAPVVEEETEPKKKPKLLFIAGGAFAVLMVILLLVVVFSRPKKTEVVEKTEPSPTPKLAIDHPLQQRVSNLQQELDAADPSEQTLVFPPIDMTITLDPVKQ